MRLPLGQRLLEAVTAFGGRSWSGTERSAVVHRHSLHVRHRFGATDPGPVIRRALLDIWAVKSSILERSSLRIGEVFALL